MKTHRRLAPPAVLSLAALVACSPDQVTAPSVPDDFLVTAEAGKQGGNGSRFIYEPARLEHTRISLTYNRTCQVNSYEDRDGDDFYSPSPDGLFRVEKVNEKDAVVWIVDEGIVTHIGRAHWDADLWFDSPTPGTGSHVSVNSKVNGVTFPVFNEQGGIDPEVRELLDWFGPYSLDPEPGAYNDDGTFVLPTGFDLLNDPLGPIPSNHPDPSLHGTEARAITRINELLAAAEAAGTLQGVGCTWHQVNWGGVIANDIEFTRGWPGSLKQLF